MIPSPAFRLARLSFLAAALSAALPAAAETVDIASAADWAAFAGRVNGGATDLGARMTADVSLPQDAPFVGTDPSHAYSGTFDGDGHTLAVDWRFTDGRESVAPFRYAKDCTIRNLRVAGSIESDGLYAAGLIGHLATGSRQAEVAECRVSAAIASTFSGKAGVGGFLGVTENVSTCKIDFRDCLFDGSLLGSSAQGCGGFAGLKYYSCYLFLHSCLFDPADIAVDASSSHTFSCPNTSIPIDSGSIGYYYTRALGTAQGTDASSMSAESLVSALGTNWVVSNGKATLKRFDAPPAVPAVAGFAYQGALNDISGTPLSGTKRIEFRLYDAATGGTPLWGRAHDVLLDGNGLFNVALADDSGEALEGIEPADPFPALLAASSSSTLYLGLTVAGSEGEIAPRQRLLPVPYASFAADSANASGPFAAAGRLSAGGLAVSGNATVQGNATFKGNLVARTNLTVSGAIRGRNDSHPAPGTVPRGAIVLWKGSSGTIPDGWALCDGSNGTPDLKGRFVVGYDPNDSDYNAIGKTGGETRHRLTTDQIPSHSHNTVVHTVGYSLSHNGDAEAATFDGYKRNNGNRDISGASTGGDQPHENRPPYYALCYIMRVK